MISAYSGSVREAVLDLLQLFVRLALPLGIVLGLGAIGLALAYHRDPAAWRQTAVDRQSQWMRAWGLVGVAVAAYLGWSFLQQLLPAARDQIEWRESAYATSKATVEADPVVQANPTIAALAERTFTRTLTLPPDFLGRIGAEGVGVLAPYLEDPSTQNVLRLVDTFRRSGRDVVFTREVTRLDERPIPLAKAEAVARFRRLDGEAYELAFEGTYTFTNPDSAPIRGRFQFPVPQAATMRDLKAEIGGTTMTDPNEYGVCEWIGDLQPGETKVARVTYRATGGSEWEYVLGSQRTRVADFRLDAEIDGAFRYPRRALVPTSVDGSRVTWRLGNVITNERLALAFPEDVVPRETYLQALGAMPVALIVFVGLAVLLASVFRAEVAPGRLLLAVSLLAVGFAASLIVASYAGYVAGVLATPLLAGVLAGSMSRPLFYAATTAAAIPATFLSAEHTGLLLLVLFLLAGMGVWRELRRGIASTPAGP